MIALSFEDKGDGDLLIREAKKDERHLVKQQRLSSYESYKDELSHKQWHLLKSNLECDTDQHPGVKVFVAEVGLEIVGSVVLFPAKTKTFHWNGEATPYPEIRLLAVIPELRSRGVGTALVEHCLDISKISKQQYVGLYTGSFMKHAIALYEKMGFERVHSLDLPPITNGVAVEAFRFDL